METFLTVLLVWITPNVLFVGWRLWVSRPAKNYLQLRSHSPQQTILTCTSTKHGSAL
jgi:hypothetical protein